MFIVNDMVLDVRTNVYYQEKKYGRALSENSLSFLWIEDLDKFLTICEKNINEFIDDCMNDTLDDLKEINLEYLLELNFPRACTLAKEYPKKFCDLLREYDILLIFKSFFDQCEKNDAILNYGIFLINPILDIFILNNKLYINGLGYFITS